MSSLRLTVLSAILMLSAGRAWADSELKIEKTISFGAAGDQAATAAAIKTGRLTLAGPEGGSKALVLHYALPPGEKPQESFVWADPQKTAIQSSTTIAGLDWRIGWQSILHDYRRAGSRRQCPVRRRHRHDPD